MSIHRESGLPWGVWKGLQDKKSKEAASLYVHIAPLVDQKITGSNALCRKRKAAPDPIPSGSSRAKQQKPLPNLSADAKLLLRVVIKCEESALRRTLASSITTASPSDLQAVKRLLGPLVASTQNPLHCVRCHASYVEQENKLGACKILHEEPDCLGDDASDDYPVSEDDSEDSRGREMYDMMRYPCCGERFREDRPDMAEEFCVYDKHTTDPKRVEYFIDPKAASKGKKKKK
ncbi:hypothetical protein FRC06_007248, partial [Ceratobasidium sp. 370]